MDREHIREVLNGMTDEVCKTYRLYLSVTEGLLSGITLVLYELWSKRLGKQAKTMGLEDNFFALGANSMSAMQLVSKERSKGIELTVAQVFQRAVLRDLCKLIEQNASRVDDTSYKDRGTEMDSETQQALMAMLTNYHGQVISEATDFQALTISEQTVGNAGLVMYRTIALGQKVDKSSVRSANQHNVERIDITRVVFVQHHDILYIRRLSATSSAHLRSV